MTAESPNSQSRWRRWLREAAVSLAVAAAAVAGVSWWQARGMLPAGTPAPGFERPELSAADASATLGPASWRGRRVLLYFFAPWCTVCKVSAGNLAHLRALAGEDATVVAVALDYEDTASVSAFAAAHGVAAPVVLGDDALRDAYRIAAYPSYYVLDGEGRIAWRSVGYSTLAGMALRLLATSP